jgi:hypothetical protein
VPRRPRATPSRNASVSSHALTVGFSVLSDGAAFFDIFSFTASGARTINLPLQLGAGAKYGGSSLVLPAGESRLCRLAQRPGGGPWYCGSSGGGGGLVPVCGEGCTLTSTETEVTLAGLTLPGPNASDGALAREAWWLTLLNATAFAWDVERTWLHGVAPALVVDRIGLALRTTGGTPIHGHQIPSFVDRERFVNRSSTGGFGLGTTEADHVLPTTAYEYLSPRSRQHVQFSPTGAMFVVDGAATLAGAPRSLLWSFARPFADGTSWCNFGFEAIDPRGAGGGGTDDGTAAKNLYPRPGPAAGTVQTFSMTMRLVATDIPTVGGSPSNRV